MERNNSTNKAKEDDKSKKKREHSPPRNNPIKGFFHKFKQDSRQTSLEHKSFVKTMDEIKNTTSSFNHSAAISKANVADKKRRPPTRINYLQEKKTPAINSNNTLLTPTHQVSQIQAKEKNVVQEIPLSNFNLNNDIPSSNNDLNIDYQHIGPPPLPVKPDNLILLYRGSHSTLCSENEPINTNEPEKTKSQEKDAENAQLPIISVTLNDSVEVHKSSSERKSDTVEILASETKSLSPLAKEELPVQDLDAKPSLQEADNEDKSVDGEKHEEIDKETLDKNEIIISEEEFKRRAKSISRNRHVIKRSVQISEATTESSINQSGHKKEKNSETKIKQTPSETDRISKSTTCMESISKMDKFKAEDSILTKNRSANYKISDKDQNDKPASKKKESEAEHSSNFFSRRVTTSESSTVNIQNRIHSYTQSVIGQDNKTKTIQPGNTSLSNKVKDSVFLKQNNAIDTLVVRSHQTTTRSRSGSESSQSHFHISPSKEPKKLGDRVLLFEAKNTKELDKDLAYNNSLKEKPKKSSVSTPDRNSIVQKSKDKKNKSDSFLVSNN